MEQHFFSQLPLEILFYILKNFLDLPDLWHMSQVCRHLKLHCKDTLKKQWKIDLDACSMYKIQAHAAMISLNSISRQLIQRIKIYDPYAFPPKLQLESMIRELDIYQPMPATAPPSSTSNTNTTSTTNTHNNNNSSSIFPPTIEPGLDDIGNESGFLLERLKYHTKRLHSILELELNLHHRILNGILSEHCMKNVIDIVFHHAVIVSAISTQRGIYNYLAACTNNSTKHVTHAFAAITSRLLCQLDRALPSCQMSKCLYENLETYLAYMEYRLLAKQQPTGIACCVDLLGATYMSNLLDIEHALLIVKKICLLLDTQVNKKIMLLDLKDVWLSIKSNELLLFVQMEINKTHNSV